MSSTHIFTVQTHKKREVIDLTDLLREQIQGSPSGIGYLFLLHTTAALTIADLDPGTDLDLLDALDALIPKLNYRHPHDPAHVPDHILSALIGPALWVPIENGAPRLGTWQRIILLEFDGPRERRVIVTTIRAMQ